MSKIIVKTHKENRKNLTCVIGGVLVAFDEKLEAHVDESDLQAILKVDPTLQFEGKDAFDIPEPKTKEEEDQDNFIAELNDAAGIEEVEVEEVEEEVATEEEQLTEATEINFDDLTKAALQDIAKESDLPSKEWSKLSKAKLIGYLKSKL